MPAAYPSGSNTFVPSHEASGSLIIGFSRNPKTFKITEYTKYVSVKKDVGYYLIITAEEAARVINAGLNDFVWSDGQEAPMGNDNLESFLFQKFATLRYAFPYNLGQKAVEQAAWDILAVHGGIAAQKAMTARTIKVLSALTTGANWGSNTSSATALVGGKLDTSTTATNLIKKAIRLISEAILQATIGVVQRTDLIMVMNPHTAGILSENAEITDHLKNNVYGLAQVRGDVPNVNGQWGLPDHLYGVKLVVEDAVRVTSKKGATKTTTYCFPNDTIAMLARPGQLMGMEGIPEFSTMQVFFYEEMTVESKQDPDNRRHVARVVDDYDVQLCAPASGYLLTATTS